MDPILRAEFTVYPFLDGDALPDYVQAAIDAIHSAGLDVDIGPLSNTLRGEADAILSALLLAHAAALGAGAGRVLVSVEVER